MTVGKMVSQLAGGMFVSIQLFLVTLIFSLPLGMVVAFGRMSKNRLLQGVVKAYISIMRGTPLMLQLMVVYCSPKALPPHTALPASTESRCGKFLQNMPHNSPQIQSMPPRSDSCW